MTTDNIDWEQYRIQNLDFDTLYHIWIVSKPQRIRFESELLRDAFYLRHRPQHGPESWRTIIKHRILTLRRLRRELQEIKTELDRRTA